MSMKNILPAGTVLASLLAVLPVHAQTAGNVVAGSTISSSAWNTALGTKRDSAAAIAAEQAAQTAANNAGTAAANEVTRALGVEAAKMQFRGAWAANAAYATNDVVLQGGVLYVAPAALTSGATFSAASWTALTTLGGSGFSTPPGASYSASGALAAPVANTNTLAIVSCAYTCAMTLAAGVTDRQPYYVKRLGAGAVTVTATIDGAANTTLTANSTTTKETLHLEWCAALNTWLVAA